LSGFYHIPGALLKKVKKLLLPGNKRKFKHSCPPFADKRQNQVIKDYKLDDEREKGYFVDAYV